MKKMLVVLCLLLGISSLSMLAFDYLNREKELVKGASIITPGSFRLKVENKWDATSEKNYADSTWDEVANLSQEGFRLFQSENAGSTWEMKSTKYGKRVKVLNIYPDLAQSNTFQSWMNSLNLYDDERNKLIDVTPVSNKNFNANPLKYLKDSNGQWQYDVLMSGSWDANYHVTMKETPAKYIMEFIDSGRGVLFGHDTVTGNLATNTHYKQFAALLGVTWTTPGNQKKWTGSTKIQLINNGYLMKYPFEIKDNVVLTIPYAHNIEVQQKNIGTVWLEFIQPSGNWPNQIYDAGNERGGWYLKTNNNIGMIQTGHSNGQSTIDERKIIANTLYNLAQVSTDAYADDYSVTDDQAPNKPTVKQLEGTFENFEIELDSVDKGKKYQWYVEANTKNQGMLTSDVVEETISSSVAGYFYKLDEQPNSNLKSEVEGYKDSYGRIPKDKYSTYVAPIGSTAISYDTKAKITGINGTTDSNKYLHVVAVDRANNVSEMTSIQLKSIMSEFQVIEQYSDDFGRSIQPSTRELIKKEQNYAKSFPEISGYSAYGFQIDNAEISEATSTTLVKIPFMKENHVVNYIYMKPIKLHLQQVILNKKEGISVPKQGTARAWNTSGQTIDNFENKATFVFCSGSDGDGVGYTDGSITKKYNYNYLHLKSSEPSFYQYVGAIVTTSNTAHHPDNRITDEPILSLESGSEYWITFYLEPKIDTIVSLNVVNGSLIVYYANINGFTVKIDGDKYQDFTVANKKSTESKVIDIPINEIRNKVSIEYHDENGQLKTIYWNDNWDFVN